MRHLSCLLAALFIALALHPQQALAGEADWQDYDPSIYNLNRAALTQVSIAFGYIAAQDARSVVTAAQFPALAPRLKNLDLIFEKRFSNPKARSEAALRSVLGDQFNSVIESLSDVLTEITATRFTEAEAYEFLKTIEQRIDGVFDSTDTLKTLLWLKYADEPEAEIADGWTSSYSSKGDPKAAGLDIRLTIPYSWKERPGDRPNVVRAWTNQNGTGLQSIMLQVRDVPVLAQATEGDIKDVFTENASDFLPQQAQSVGKMITEIEGEPALRLDFSMQAQRAGRELDLYFRTFMMFAKGRYVSLTCSGINNGPSIEAINNLCFREANSLVIMDLWQ